jgi:hypothetical protein
MRLDFEAKTKPLIAKGSPLAEWVGAFIGKTFQKVESLSTAGGEVGLSLHDPLCVCSSIPFVLSLGKCGNPQNSNC